MPRATGLEATDAADPTAAKQVRKASTRRPEVDQISAQPAAFSSHVAMIQRASLANSISGTKGSTRETASAANK